MEWRLTLRIITVFSVYELIYAKTVPWAIFWFFFAVLCVLHVHVIDGIWFNRGDRRDGRDAAAEPIEGEKND
uniref:DUF3329 domain-containing protein n=1 Tax=Caenorhabditis tropicalis TaxID=1561998 RepID=A0A1I7TC61_9PELO